MKYAIVLPDGAADEPVAELGGRTPLEAAMTPHMDWIAMNGRQGRVVTVPKGYSPASDVATMSLLGYDPKRHYTGRAPLEAVARGIPIKPDEVVFRCNFVTIVDGLMEDFTAGHITQKETERLIADLNDKVASAGSTFYTGVSYRNLLVMSGASRMEPKCIPPHDFPNRPVGDHLPTGPGSDWVKSVTARAQALLAEHDVNLVRRDLGQNPATDIWLWGQGRPAELESFHSRFGISSALVAAVDLIRGIALSAGMEILNVPGATGYLDTDYRAKGLAAVNALDDFDLVLVHVEAPDEAGHQGDAEAKVTAIERVDEDVLGPVLDKIRTFDKWKILVAPDHPTPVGSRLHSAVPPPFCIAGHAVHSVLKKPFTESNSVASDLKIDPGHELMEYFLKP